MQKIKIMYGIIFSSTTFTLSNTSLLVIGGSILGIGFTIKILMGFLRNVGYGGGYFMSPYAGAQRTQQEGNSLSFSSIIIFAGMSLLIWLLAFGNNELNSSQENISPSTHESERVNYNISPSKKSDLKVRKKKKEKKKNERKERKEFREIDEIRKSIDASQAPKRKGISLDLEKEQQRSTIQHSKEYYIQISSLRAYNQSYLLATKYQNLPGKATGRIGIIKNKETENFPYKVIIGPFRTKSLAKKYLQENPENVPSKNWIRPREVFEQVYFIDD